MAAQKKIPLLQLYTDFGESENVSVQILINGENASEAIRELLGLASRIKDASDYREEEKVLAEKAPKKESESKSKKTAQANSAPSDSAPTQTAPAADLQQAEPAGDLFGDEPIPTDVELREIARKIGQTSEGKAAIKELLGKYGVPNITAVPNEKRVAFKRDLEALAR